MTDAKTRYLEGAYLSNNPSWHSEDASWKADNIFKLLKRQAIELSSICEVGCGAGEILVQLSTRIKAPQYFGYEISPQAFEICKRKECDQVRFILGDLTQDESIYFDLLLVIDVFEHVEDYFGFLRKLKSKSKYQIFHIPLDMSVSTVLRNTPILYAREKVGHLHYFSKDTALATLQDVGYDIIDFFYTPGSMSITSKSFKTQLANLPRKFLYYFNKDFSVRVLGGYSLMVLTKSF
jgi:hypothetical protein